MKALSIKQPWAWAILHAGKDIENRTWATSHRGDIAIHATSLQPGSRLPPGVALPSESDLVFRAVVGVVEIVDVVAQSRSPWFIGPRGFVLRNPRPLTQPVKCPGNRNVWILPEAVERAVRRGLKDSRREPAAGGAVPSTPLAVRYLTVTQGNLNNHHLYLASALDLFPNDVLGGGNHSQSGKTVRVIWGEEHIDTDIVKRRLFRRRSWLRRFFAAHSVQPGDRLCLEQLAPYVYRLSKEVGAG